MAISYASSFVTWSQWRAIKALIACAQTADSTDFEVFTNQFRRSEKEFAKHMQNLALDVNGRRVAQDGFISMATLSSLLFLSAVQDGDEASTFKFLLDKMLSDVTSVHDLESLDILFDKFIQFRMNVKTSPVTKPALGFVAASSHLLTKTSVKASKGLHPISCSICRKSFEP